jgi:carbon-monoxide dehydrogenase large subunit
MSGSIGLTDKVKVFKGRREDKRLLTGTGCYTADCNRPGQIYAALLRADRAHARIDGVDVAAAAAAPGVVAVLTAQDMTEAGYTRGQVLFPFKGPNGEGLKSVRSPALAQNRVRFVGEAVALVVAESVEAAQDAVELIDVRYDALDPVLDGRAALEPGAPLLHDEIPGNLCFDFRYGDDAAAAAAFASAAHVVRLDHASNRVVGNPMEPKAALLQWDGDVLDIWCSNQGMTFMRQSLSAMMGIPEERLRVHAQDVGGAFGIRSGAYPEYAALALAARRTGRPVKWVATRSETFLSDYHGRSVQMFAELALDAEGTFLAVRHDWVCDLGGYPSAAGAFTNTFNAAVMATGAYRIPAIYGRVRLAVTNKIPITAYRGAGRPDAAFMMERLVEEAARQTGIDRLLLRRRNFIPTHAFPYRLTTSPFPMAYDSADFGALLDRAEAESDWPGFPGRRADAAARGKLRGIGCAVFVEPSGGGTPTDEALITFEPGGGILLHEVAIASGQGHETVFPELVAHVLQIDSVCVTLKAGRADSPPLKGGASIGSRTLMSMGSVFVDAVGLVLRKGHALAADALEAAETDIEYAGGQFRIAGTDRTIGLFQLAQRYPGALDSKAERPAFMAFPSGAHVAEVEIDPDTGTTQLVRYVSVDDCGTVINETLTEGQIWGGLLQGLGQVFGENCVYDADGQLISGSFMDYFMPRADLVPNATVLSVPIPSPTNQLGAKGVGEAGTVGALATAMNAVLDALRPAGVTHLEMPVSAHRVWSALHPPA